MRATCPRVWRASGGIRISSSSLGLDPAALAFGIGRRAAAARRAARAAGCRGRSEPATVEPPPPCSTTTDTAYVRRVGRGKGRRTARDRAAPTAGLSFRVTPRVAFGGRDVAHLAGAGLAGHAHGLVDDARAIGGAALRRSDLGSCRGGTARRWSGVKPQRRRRRGRPPRRRRCARISRGSTARPLAMRARHHRQLQRRGQHKALADRRRSAYRRPRQSWP